MMMRNYSSFFFGAGLLLLLLSCNSKQANGTSTQKQAEEETTFPKTVRGVPVTAAELLNSSGDVAAQADTLADGTVIHRASSASPFCTGIWVMDGILTIQDGEPLGEQGKGRWMRFHCDGRMSIGTYGIMEREGQWNVFDDRKIIEWWFSDAPAHKLGYRYQSKGDAVVFIGSADYNCNGTQMKFLREQFLPEP